MSGQELRQAALMAKKVRSEEGVLFLALALPFPPSSQAESAWLWVSQRMRGKKRKREGDEIKHSSFSLPQAGAAEHRQKPRRPNRYAKVVEGEEKGKDGSRYAAALVLLLVLHLAVVAHCKLGCNPSSSLFPSRRRRRQHCYSFSPTFARSPCRPASLIVLSFPAPA